MNWGNKLIAVFIGFGVLMGYMVYRCTKVPVNLVSSEYYKDELAFQQVIDGNGMAMKLSTPVVLVANHRQLLLQLPPEMKSKTITGELLLYCPAKAENDKKFELRVDDNGRQAIPIDAHAEGNYEVKLSWQSDSIAYFSQQTLIIPK